MSDAIRIASCSIMPEKWNKAANLEKMLSFMDEAMREEPDLIVTPEGCLEGYVVNEAIKLDRAAEMMELAEPQDGEAMARFRAFCRERKVNALIGFCERVGDEAYNTALWIGRSGETVGFYRKTHFAEGYNPAHHFNRSGKEIRAFDTELGRVGVMICYDRRVPEVARCLALDGAEFFLVPSYGVYTGWNDAVLVARAHENELPLLFTHPNKTLAVNSGGAVIVVREEADAITHVKLQPRKDPSSMITLRRPKLFHRLVEE